MYKKVRGGNSRINLPCLWRRIYRGKYALGHRRDRHLRRFLFRGRTSRPTLPIIIVRLCARPRTLTFALQRHASFGLLRVPLCSNRRLRPRRTPRPRPTPRYITCVVDASGWETGNASNATDFSLVPEIIVPRNISASLAHLYIHVCIHVYTRTRAYTRTRGVYGKRTLKGNARRLEGKNAFAFYVTRGEPLERSGGTGRVGRGSIKVERR